MGYDSFGLVCEANTKRRGLGKGIRELKDASNDIKREIRQSASSIKEEIQKTEKDLDN